MSLDEPTKKLYLIVYLSDNDYYHAPFVTRSRKRIKEHLELNRLTLGKSGGWEKVTAGVFVLSDFPQIHKEEEIE